jgi:hypothetical protein
MVTASNDISTASATYVDMTDMALTIVLPRPGLVLATFVGNFYHSASNRVINVQLLHGSLGALGVPISLIMYSTTDRHNQTTTALVMCPAGDNLFKVQWNTNVATAHVVQRCLWAVTVGGL